jgi:hypothetical protein
MEAGTSWTGIRHSAARNTYNGCINLSMRLPSMGDATQP